MRIEPRRFYRDYKPHGAPTMGDSSTPKRADHEAHVLAVWRALKGKGFPFYEFAPPRARRVA